MADSVDINTVYLSTFATDAGNAILEFVLAVDLIDHHMSSIGDPANNGVLRTLLETAIGALRLETAGIEFDTANMSDRLREISIAFPEADVELATSSGGGM